MLPRTLGLFLFLMSLISSISQAQTEANIAPDKAVSGSVEAIKAATTDSRFI